MNQKLVQAYIHKRIYRLHCNKLKADEWMRSPLQSFIWVHFYNTERKRFLKATLMQVFPSGERDLRCWRRRLELRRPASVQESAAKDALLRAVGSEWCTLSHSGFTILRCEGQLSRRMKSQNQYRTKFKADIGELYSIIKKFSKTFFCYMPFLLRIQITSEQPWRVNYCLN